jgi:hypothetical protein
LLHGLSSPTADWDSQKGFLSAEPNYKARVKLFL